MHAHSSVSRGLPLALLLAIGMIGCRPTSTSYQVKWARPSETVASGEPAAKSEPKAAEIKQTGGEATGGETQKPPRIGVDFDYADVQAEPPQSGWRNLLGLNQPKRVRLPRTDLPGDGEPMASDPSASEF